MYKKITITLTSEFDDMATEDDIISDISGEIECMGIGVEAYSIDVEDLKAPNKDEKEFHWYMNLEDMKRERKGEAVCLGYFKTEEAIKNFTNMIITDQSHFISTSLFANGYRVFLHFDSKNIVEVKIGDNRPYTDREIRWNHNLEKLVLSGEFGGIV